MRNFRVFLFREEKGVLFKEAHVSLLHLVPPQFHMHEGATLTQEQALSLLEIAGKGGGWREASCRPERVPGDSAPPGCITFSGA